MLRLNQDEVIRLTQEYGGEWGLNHTRRLLKLVSMIGEGRHYDAEAIWLAAHLHDWGAYGKWKQEGVDHAIRSRQVAESFLKEHGFAEAFSCLVLECIEFHHSPDPNRSLEAILLCDADALDFLGVVGVLRDFSKNPRDLRKAYETVKRRRSSLPDKLILDKSREIAALRIMRMDELLEAFEQETSGCF
jgi:uncharacterized protein